MLFKCYKLCDCLKQLIQLFEANFPCPDVCLFRSSIWSEQTNTKDLKNSSC